MLKYITYPIFLFISILGVSLIEHDKGFAASALLIGAILLMFWFELKHSYRLSWSWTCSTLKRDVFHFFTNHSLLTLSLVSISVLDFKRFGFQSWPHEINFHLQTLIAIFILDFGITITHYFSHKVELLWKFHEPHHSLSGLYGFNGLMKHPVHQLIESTMGVLPLLVMGVNSEVLQAVTFCVSIQLLLQHSNVDYTVGPLRFLLAVAENHRFHHAKGPEGNVNFGLFFTVWDYFLGTLKFEKENKTFEVGLIEEYPQHYTAQLIEPYIRIRRKK